MDVCQMFLPRSYWSCYTKLTSFPFSVTYQLQVVSMVTKKLLNEPQHLEKQFTQLMDKILQVQVLDKHDNIK